MKKLIAMLAVASLMAITSFAQTNVILITNVVITPQKEVRVFWTSAPHRIYEIDEADSLIDTNTGTTVWHKLYDDYPSQGTNTFWQDAGNYNTFPKIVHPRFAPMRFYRVVDKGIDDLTNDEPTIMVLSPTNNAVITGALTISVSNYTDQALVINQLYVDGQEMWPSSDGEHYAINTCEWENGRHIIFATATEYSTAQEDMNTTTPLVGHSVSAFVPVFFSNLVTQISFSQPEFRPELGQTQEIIAVLMANCNWTLTIHDDNNNVVRTAIGSGNHVLYDWDGTESNGTLVPVGNYYYDISAQTNGLADEIVTNGGGSINTNSPPSPGGDDEQTYVLDDNSATPLAIYPPNYNTNDLTIVSAKPSQVREARAGSFSAARASYASSGGGFTPLYLSSNLPATEIATNTPTKTPSIHPARSHGTFAMGIDTYTQPPSVGYFQPTPPVSYVLVGGAKTYVSLEGHGSADPPKWYPLRSLIHEELNFFLAMNAGGWGVGLQQIDDQLNINELKSSGDANPFNTNDFAILFLHGCYGSSSDMSTGKSFKQMYFPITQGQSAQYLRMSDLNLGGSAPGVGLKWIALEACYSLYPDNWNSMTSQNVFPYNSNLHMILGAATLTVSSPTSGTYFAQDMMGSSSKAAMTIRAAWYDGYTRGMAIDFQKSGDSSITTQLNAAYDANCANDYLQTVTNTMLAGGNWKLDPPQQVYPPQ